MLVLTCRIGGVIRLGQGVRITLAARMGQRVAVSLVAPLDQPVMFDRACLQPVALSDGLCSYLFSLQGIRSFHVGGLQVGLWMPGEVAPEAGDYQDYIHIGVLGAGPLRLAYEQDDDSEIPVVTATAAATACLMN